jgi:hypothetical protein
MATLLWAGLALAAVAIATRLERPSLLVHSAWLLAAAAIASGLAGVAWGALASTSPRGDVPVSAVLVALGCPLAYGLAARAFAPPFAAAETSRLVATVGRVALALLSFLALVALAARALVRLAGTDDARIATARTAALCLGVTAVAVTSRLAARHELRGLVYALLVVAALKVVAVDLLAGQPAMMFVSCALLGATVLAASRLLHLASTDA